MLLLLSNKFIGGCGFCHCLLGSLHKEVDKHGHSQCDIHSVTDTDHNSRNRSGQGMSGFSPGLGWGARSKARDVKLRAELWALAALFHCPGWVQKQQFPQPPCSGASAKP